MIIAPFRGILGGQNREIPPASSTLVHLTVLAWKNRSLHSTVIYGTWLMIWSEGQGLGREKIEGSVKEKLGEKACDWTLRMDPTSRVYLCPIGTLTLTKPEDPGRKGFKKQVVKMISLWMPVSVFSWSPQCLLNGLSDNAALDVTWSWGDIRFFPSWEEEQFFFIGTATYSGFGFASPACHNSSSRTICRLCEYLIHCLDIPYNIAVDQEIHFTARRVSQWTEDNWIHWSSRVPHYQEINGPIKL